MAHPYKIVSTVSELEPQDLIFICVKNYSLETVCSELKECVTEDTIVVPVMNGVDPGERVRTYIRKGIVLDSLIYIVAFLNADGSVTQQGDFANVRIGAKNADQKTLERAKAVAELMTDAGIDCMAAEDIEKEIWKKYILNCAYNVETAAYNNTIGQLREDKEKAKQYEALVWEAYAVAKAKKVAVKEEDAVHIIHRFYHEHAYEATSSLQRDVNAGRQTELDTFCGYLVREAKRLSVKAPVTEKMYAILQEKCDI